MLLCAVYILKKSRSGILFTVQLLLSLKFMFVLLKGSGAAQSDERDIELNRCGAYQVVELSRQRVKMTENSAYGEVGAAIH